MHSKGRLRERTPLLRASLSTAKPGLSQNSNELRKSELCTMVLPRQPIEIGTTMGLNDNAPPL
jgi:hypothetical protein